MFYEPASVETDDIVTQFCVKDCQIFSYCIYDNFKKPVYIPKILLSKYSVKHWQVFPQYP
jgi:hypothetical protein